MKIKARVNVAGKPTTLEIETGFLRMEVRGQLDLLRHRTDRNFNVWQQRALSDGTRETLPVLLEVEAPTLDALLNAVENDEARLRGPLVRNSNTRTVRTMNRATGLFEFKTDGVPMQASA